MPIIMYLEDIYEYIVHGKIIIFTIKLFNYTCIFPVFIFKKPLYEFAQVNLDRLLPNIITKLCTSVRLWIYLLTIIEPFETVFAV